METLINITELEVNFKTTAKTSERFKISKSDDYIRLFHQLHGKEIEHRENFYLVCLNNANEVMGYFHLSSGGICGTVVDIRMIFQVALNCNATAIMLNHNHPSGNIKPSQNDIDITNQIKKASKILNVKLLDHIISSKEDHYSFANNGIL